ncbi:MAG: thioester domain-containing protein, partial [Clostridiales Family XIII bacterium]|nr:thioester domain-containing protein [Clostridiales Family XIII bacterium]
MKSCLRLCAAASASLCAGLLFSAVAFAAGGPDANSYKVELRYDDNIQINYQHPDVDGWWRGDGDIPLGGAALSNGSAISQLYCVDATVPFHSRVGPMGGVTSSSGGKTVDTVPNYVAVSPDKLPEALKANWSELLWLVINGYSDAASLSDMRTRYANLSDLINPTSGSLANFDYAVAVMATKVAIWHFTNPNVAYYSTSFLKKSKGDPQSTDGIKHRQFVALTKRLVEDASAYAANPLNVQQMKLVID